MSQISLLDQIKKRSGIYLGTKSITALYHFIHGYSTACLVHNLENELDVLISREFHDWCAYRTHFKESTSGWCNMICSVTDSEDLAFDYFFKLLDEYKSRKPTKVARISGVNKSYIQIQGENRQELKYPSSVVLIIYTSDPGFFVESEIEGQQFPQPKFFPYIDWFESSINIKKENFEIINSELFSQILKYKN